MIENSTQKILDEMELRINWLENAKNRQIEEKEAFVGDLRALELVIEKLSNDLKEAKQGLKDWGGGLPTGSQDPAVYRQDLHKPNGSFETSANLAEAQKIQNDVAFQFREKACCSLIAASSWYGGDYFEFGSHGLNTFRNMLTAYDICGMSRVRPDVRFYAFDIFGDPTVNAKNTKVAEDFIAKNPAYVSSGNVFREHQSMIEKHGLYVDQCILVQGLYENTLTEEFKKMYKSERREIGYAFLDCNHTETYKEVLEFVFGLLAMNSYIYMDQYFQNVEVMELWDDCEKKLFKKRKIKTKFVRSAGGTGAIFRLYDPNPYKVDCPKYEINV